MIIYTDGSCINKQGGYGFVVITENNVIEKYGRINGPCTNQIAELYAIYQALLFVDRQQPITIKSDSMYSILSLTNYIKRWKVNGYLTANNKPVKNKDLIANIDALLTESIQFEHVRAHSGIIYNERADYLANLGRKMIQFK